MTQMRTLGIVGLLVVSGQFAAAAQWRVGVARTDITPAQSLWLAGYGNRKHVADGAVHPLWAKAMTVADQSDHRVVIVTLDLIGDNFERSVGDAIGAGVAQRTGIARQNIVLNFSHTHCGPVTHVGDGAIVTYHVDDRQRAALDAYTRELERKLINLVAEAFSHLVPAELAFGQGSAKFGVNRRSLRDGRFVIAPNTKGPVDPVVPVLRVRTQGGQLLAVLFGYACHNTTLGGDFYKYCGDYAGFAQIALETEYPGATAMFMQGCGGDINPEPRGRLELAEQHGKSLATAVRRVLDQDMHSVQGPLAVAFTRVDLPFVDGPSKQELQQRRHQGSVFDQRLAAVLIQRIEQHGKLATGYPCPVQVIRFGDDLSIVGLAGEVVVDYALRLRQLFAAQPVWIAGYCNEVFAYVPSERVLVEGGYEGGDSMKYFGWHGPFKPGVESRVVDTVKELMDRTSTATVRGRRP